MMTEEKREQAYKDIDQVLGHIVAPDMFAMIDRLIKQGYTVYMLSRGAKIIVNIFHEWPPYGRMTQAANLPDAVLLATHHALTEPNRYDEALNPGGYRVITEED